MWAITEFKKQLKSQEMAVVSTVREMALYTWAYNAETFESAFKEQLKDIPRSNNFSAEYMYKVKHLNQYSIEVWKVRPNGDFNYKMFQLDFIK